MTQRKETALAKARKVFLDNPNFTRDQFIDELIHKHDIGISTARSYYSVISTQFGKLFGLQLKKRVRKVPMKRELAFNICKANSLLPRKELITLVRKELNVTDNSASTMVSKSMQLIKKENISLEKTNQENNNE